MAEFVIKPIKSRDEYVLWSTVVNAPTGYGNRARILAHLEQQWRLEHPNADPKPGHTPADRLARADRTGTSCLDADFGGWGHHRLIYESSGYLPRRLLFRAAELLAKGREAKVRQMLLPFEDEGG